MSYVVASVNLWYSNQRSVIIKDCFIGLLCLVKSKQLNLNCVSALDRFQKAWVTITFSLKRSLTAACHGSVAPCLKNDLFHSENLYHRLLVCNELDHNNQRHDATQHASLNFAHPITDRIYLNNTINCFDNHTYYTKEELLQS